MNRLKYTAFLLGVCGVFLLGLGYLAQAAPKPGVAYSKFFSGKKSKASTVDGLVRVHKIEGKIYLELPRELLGKRFLMGTAVEAVSDPMESSPGYKIGTPKQIVFERTDSLVLMSSVSDRNRAVNGDTTLAQAIRQGEIPTVEFATPIIALTPDSSALLFDATKLFIGRDKDFEPLDPRAYNSYGGFVSRKAEYDSDNSMIQDIASFADNFSAVSSMNYKISLSLFGLFSIAKDRLLTANVRRTFALLPDSTAPVRYADPRIGTTYSSHTEFDPNNQSGARIRHFAQRWNIASHDTAKITFYVDDNFPALWQTAIREAFGEWNRSFEKMGIRDAITVKMFSEGGDDFSPSNIKYSCVNYVVSPMWDINDHIWNDPRSGEILSANIYVSCNVTEEIQRNRLLATAAADPQARTLRLGDQVIAEAIKAKMLKSIGRCLGLENNYAGSASFCVASGLSASVMDELPYNYMVSAADREGGVFVQTSLGVYDDYVIEWLYGGAPDSLLAAHRGDTRYMYGKKQPFRTFYDPRSQPGDLGNDPIASAQGAISALAGTLANANRWLDAEDYDYQYREALYDFVFQLVLKYMEQPLINVGGIYLNEKFAGEPIDSYRVVPADVQRKSLLWLMDQISDMSWIDSKELIANSGLTGSPASYVATTLSSFVFSQIESMWLSESKSDKPYRQQDAMQDVFNVLWKGYNAGTEIGELRRTQQEMFITVLVKWSNVAKASVQGKAGSASSLAAHASLALALDGRLPVMAAGRQRLENMMVANAMGPFSQVSYPNNPDKEHIWYAMLLDCRAKCVAASAAARSTELRDHYRYLIFKIDRALKK